MTQPSKGRHTASRKRERNRLGRRAELAQMKSMACRTTRVLGRLLAVIATALAPAGALAADQAHPVVVELFESQGCSSCPPASANLARIVDRGDVLALTFQVTYWDDQGWKDTFASPVFTARQWDYARGLGHDNVYTPQVVVNGRRDGDGTNPRAFADLLRAGDRGQSGPQVSIGSGKVTISAGAALRESADVWLIRYDPRTLQVAIKRGENSGKTLPHRNIVRQISRIGAWRGRHEVFTAPPTPDPIWRTAVIVQSPHGGPVLAAARS